MKKLITLILVLLIIDGLWSGASNLRAFELFTLPRLVLAILAGMAYAVAGYLFQLCFKNPLASPDIIGINAGASAGALISLSLLGSTGVILNFGALVGSAVVCVFALLFARPMIASNFVSRLVLIGIALSSFALSIVAYILSTMPIGQAQQSMQWLTGTLHDADWDKNFMLGIIVIIAAALLAYYNKALSILQLPENSAYSLGVVPQQLRAILLAIAVILAASATAMCGPVLFVAFLSPQLARIIVPEEKYRPISVALTGVIFMLLADIISQHIIPGQKYPVGAITGILGAVYLVRTTFSQRVKVQQ
ncbi:MAG: iron ABC transporter permease [Micrococcaceae bacterium]